MYVSLFPFYAKRKNRIRSWKFKKGKKNQQYVLALVLTLSVPIYAVLTRNKLCSTTRGWSYLSFSCTQQGRRALISNTRIFVHYLVKYVAEKLYSCDIIIQNQRMIGHERLYLHCFVLRQPYATDSWLIQNSWWKILTIKKLFSKEKQIFSSRPSLSHSFSLLRINIYFFIIISILSRKGNTFLSQLCEGDDLFKLMYTYENICQYSFQLTDISKPLYRSG